MMVVIVYDISTKTLEGKRRLRRMGKICSDYGTPVQNSVYECELDSGIYCMVREMLKGTINEMEDSVRFYLLGNNFQNRIEVEGKETVGWDRKNYFI